ncbi:MAG TPA: sulfur carrier protein ThiS [Desulfuromonadales bacterium]|nr:sulfur carrier protein ThiS [Desulfuromonadales bacterium]
MRIVVNGDAVEAADGCSVVALLLQLGIGRDRVAFELNGAIVPKANYEKQLLADDDKIEIVHFVGGG